MSRPTIRFFDHSHFSQAILYSAHKVVVRQSPEWRMLGFHPDFGRFVAKWFKEPGGVVVVATQF